jgi:hypothetical protein
VFALPPRIWLILVLHLASSACLPPAFDVEPPFEDAPFDEASTTPEAQPNDEADTQEQPATDEADGSAGQSEATEMESGAPEASPDDAAIDVGCDSACCPDCAGKECGASDGCGQTCTEGFCPAPEVCGGAGVPNQCGCASDCENKDCGADDGCAAEGQCDGTCPLIDGPAEATARPARR